MSMTRRMTVLSTLLAAPLLLMGCATSAASDTPDPADADAETTQGVELNDAWAKADEGMTGVFGTIENHGAEDLVLTSAESDTAGIIELHETSTSGENATMSEVEGGFEIPAGGTHALEPGGDHIMLMELHEELLAGDEIPLTLHFDDDSSFEFSILVKDFAGAQENYDDVDSDHDDDHHEHDHGDH
ncbi:MAG: copper chaperone PCu(A)C [Leucobacter sp.]